jgi:hypothetical protein
MAESFAQFSHKGWLPDDTQNAVRVGHAAKFLIETFGTQQHGQVWPQAPDCPGGASKKYPTMNTFEPRARR